MGFKELLSEKLAGKVEKEKLVLLPKGFQKIGDIVVLNLNSELVDHKEDIGKAVLEIFPKVKSVCNKFGEITGKFREPQIEVIAGSEDTVTTHIESGCKYRFDIRKVMFAKGNVIERTRLPKQVKPGETIIDMFAGIGYFTIGLGKLSKAKKIYSIELNPVSFEYLKENLKINHIRKVEPILGNCAEEVKKLSEEGIKADRIVMGYLPAPLDYVKYAVEIINPNGIIHYEDVLNVDNKEEEIDRVMREFNEQAEPFGRKTELLLARRIKSYGPKMDHYVFDIKIL